MLLTDAVFQPPMSWLKAAAEENIQCMLLTDAGEGLGTGDWGRGREWGGMGRDEERDGERDAEGWGGTGRAGGSSCTFPPRSPKFANIFFAKNSSWAIRAQHDRVGTPGVLTHSA